MSRVLAELESFRAGILKSYPELRGPEPVLVEQEPRKKLHWTQRPENAAKVKRMARKGRLARKKQST